jgi:hypothetical protein
MAGEQEAGSEAVSALRTTEMPALGGAITQKNARLLYSGK